MSDPISLKDIELTPIAGKAYFNSEREWREEFIYFLMVDRFQDDIVRPAATGTGRSTEHLLRRHHQGGHAQPRILRWPGLYGPLALARVREQP